MTKVELRATSEDTRSESILVSFSAKWRRAIEAGTIRAVIRKRVPSSTNPAIMYLYVGSPEKAIVARASISRVVQIPVSEAICLNKDLGIQSKEILAYCGNLQNIGYYHLNSLELADPALKLEDIQAVSHFHPPQSFLYLSQDGERVIHKLTSFNVLWRSRNEK